MVVPLLAGINWDRLFDPAIFVFVFAGAVVITFIVASGCDEVRRLSE